MMDQTDTDSLLKSLAESGYYFALTCTDNGRWRAKLDVRGGRDGDYSILSEFSLTPNLALKSLQHELLKIELKKAEKGNP